MFTSEHIETYLADTYPEIADDKRVLKLKCYVNPISHALAKEVNEELADMLFKKSGTEWLPRSIANATRFNLNIKPHSLSFVRHPTYPGDRVFIPTVLISKLEAGKVTPESNHWALMFTLSFEPQDKQVHRDLFELLHEKFYLTFQALQPGLFPEKDEWADLLCRLCDAPNPQWGVQGSKPKIAYCSKCKDQKMDDEKLIRIADHARAQVAAEEDQPEESKPGDPLLSGSDINGKAAKRQRKGRVN